jgi:putative transposase
MCNFFGVSRAAYYAWVSRSHKADKDTGRMQWVQAAYAASRQTYGYWRITLWIREHKQASINQKAVLRLMNKLGIRSVARKRKVYKKLDEIESIHTYPNILNREFAATRPNQKWVTDVTYIHTQQGWAYLAVVKDLFDGFIVAYGFERRNSVGLVTKTIQLAKQKEGITKGLILHSNQGHQYTSDPYHLLVTE